MQPAGTCRRGTCVRSSGGSPGANSVIAVRSTATGSTSLTRSTSWLPTTSHLIPGASFHCAARVWSTLPSTPMSPRQMIVSSMSTTSRQALIIARSASRAVRNDRSKTSSDTSSPRCRSDQIQVVSSGSSHVAGPIPRANRISACVCSPFTIGWTGGISARFSSSMYSSCTCAAAASATPTLEELGEFFAEPDFDEQLDVMNPLGDGPLDVSSLPTLELPDTVLFPDESVTLTVSRTDPLLRLVEQGGAVVRLGDAPPATIVKFRPRFSQPREDDGAVCTLGTVSVTARYGPGEASLHVLTCARVINDQNKNDPPGRNPAYPVFDSCAAFPELRENSLKLIHQSPGIDAVPGSNLLDRLEAIEQVGRVYDEQFPDEPGGRDDGENEAPGRPMRFLDVAADFIAVSLIREIPGLEVPFRLQQEWLDLLDPCARVRALNAFVAESLDDLMTPDRIYGRHPRRHGSSATSACWCTAGNDPRQELHAHEVPTPRFGTEQERRHGFRQVRERVGHDVAVGPREPHPLGSDSVWQREAADGAEEHRVDRCVGLRFLHVALPGGGPLCLSHHSA